MTSFTERLEFPPLVAAVRAGDAAAVDALWDLLEESGATTADVMTLYAVPPAWPCERCEGVGEIGPCGLTDYYRRCVACNGSGITAKPDEDDSLHPVLACWAERHGPPGRGAAVRAWEMVRQVQGSGWLVQYERSPGDFFSVVHTAEWGARRELKRRVLGLFADVRVPCPNCKGKGAVVRSGPLAGACIRCYGSGAVTPANLIPPESQRRVIPRPPPAGSVYLDLEPS